MNKYIDYIFTSIIQDVNGFSEIFRDYNYLSWIIVWFLWLVWISIKYSLLTMPIWLPVRRIVKPLNFSFLKVVLSKIKK